MGSENHLIKGTWIIMKFSLQLFSHDAHDFSGDEEGVVLPPVCPDLYKQSMNQGSGAGSQFNFAEALRSPFGGKITFQRCRTDSNTQGKPGLALISVPGFLQQYQLLIETEWRARGEGWVWTEKGSCFPPVAETSSIFLLLRSRKVTCFTKHPRLTDVGAEA